jgi:hydrogenase expression/formation protein HypE
MKNDIITLAHGGGGSKTKQIIDDIIMRYLGNPILKKLDDAACLHVPESEMVFTTDSYVVTPLFFPGGDIGKLSVCGTINDLVMQGAEPKYISLSLILEEGFAIAELEKIIKSAGEVLKKTKVLAVTGDTKVVERGSGNGIFINTAGIGVRRREVDVHVSNAKPGDVVIITGTIGDHGISIMGQRKGLKLESKLISDVAPLGDMICPLINKISAIHVLRDPTRGGIAAALCDIAEKSNVGICIEESLLKVKDEVRGVCGLLGFDPLNIANEGKAIVICPEEDSKKALKILKSHSLGKESYIVGRVTLESAGTVLLKTNIGGKRIVSVPSGENLPRIC